MGVPSSRHWCQGSSPLARGLPPHRHRRHLRERIIPARAGFTRRCPGRDPRAPDHPRSRGVYDGAPLFMSASLGSSPLARGLPDCRRWRGQPWGDHPRSRGVYIAPRTMLEQSMGSSPLARGLRWRSTKPGSGPGIIPARAGFTVTSTHRSAGMGDHPRSRGVYRRFPRGRRWTWGSSPLARGLQQPGRHADRRVRIIPARAGFTRLRTSNSSRMRDHPRSRGVYLEGGGAAAEEAGSSPLARGLPAGRAETLHRRRIIPARAGFTGRRWRPDRRRRDHPRSRGVYRDFVDHHRVVGGSSPLARGLPSRHPNQLRGHRDHPRSRGVYPELDPGDECCVGSSPLARGLLTWWRIRCRGLRIIPARAGFTLLGLLPRLG